MKLGRLAVLTVVVVVVAMFAGCGPDKSEKLKNGVTFAKGALEQVGVNPLATATYQSLNASGITPAKYVNYLVPKTDPVWTGYEEGKPTHPWTIVVRPTAVPNEFSVEGFGDDLKKPLMVEYVTVKAPSQE